MGKPSAVSTFAILSLMLQAWGVELPESYEVDRYSLIWERAPFVAVTEVTPERESLAKRFAITGFARTGGDELLFLFDRKGLKRFVVSKAVPREGIEIVSVDEGQSIRELKAKVKADGEVVELVFDPTLQESGEKQPGQEVPMASVAPSPQATATPRTQSIVREAPKPGHTVRRRTPIAPN